MQTVSIKKAGENLPDGELAQRIAAGDLDALQILMRRYNQTLYRTARSILRDDAEAEDAVQESYLLAYRAMDKFRGDAKLATWLVRIVVNESIARMRKRKRRAEVIELSGDSARHGEDTEVNMNEVSPSPNRRRCAWKRAACWRPRSTSCPTPSARCLCCARWRK